MIEVPSSFYPDAGIVHEVSHSHLLSLLLCAVIFPCDLTLNNSCSSWCQNNSQTFSPFLKHMSPLKEKLINAASGNNHCLFWELYETHKYSVAKMQLLSVEAGGTCSYPWALEGEVAKWIGVLMPRKKVSPAFVKAGQSEVGLQANSWKLKFFIHLRLWKGSWWFRQAASLKWAKDMSNM